MLIFIIFGIILIGSLILFTFAKRDCWKEFCILISISMSTFLIIAIVTLFISRGNDRSNIRKYSITEMSIDTLKQNKMVEPEKSLVRTLLISESLKINQEIATAKYWNNTIFDIWTVDEYANLPYLNY